MRKNAGLHTFTLSVSQCCEKTNAKIACKKSNYIIEDHFLKVGKMIELAKGAKRTIQDYKLSRYVCYLVV